MIINIHYPFKNRQNHRVHYTYNQRVCDFVNSTKFFLWLEENEIKFDRFRHEQIGLGEILFFLEESINQMSPLLLQKTQNITLFSWLGFMKKMPPWFKPFVNSWIMTQFTKLHSTVLSQGWFNPLKWW